MSTQTDIFNPGLTAEEANALPHDDARRGLQWAHVTKTSRQEYIAAKTEMYLEKIAEERKGKVKKQNLITETQRTQAANLAKGDWTAFNYRLPEYQGYINPLQEDLEWGPNSTEAQQPKEDFKPNRYGGRCPKCDQWVEEQAGKLVKLPSGKWGAEHLTCPEVSQPEEKTSQPVKGTDLTDLPSGYYAVPDGDTRLKVRISHGKAGSKWEGYTFVTDGAAYGQQTRYGMQRPGQAYKGQIEDKLAKIAAQPLEAMKEYGKLVGRCGACNAILEDETSVANGIGPICAQKF